jgi:hypothetical protein
VRRPLNKQFVEDLPAATEPPEFANSEDIERRLGRSLTEAEEGIAESVVASVTGLIAEAAGMNAAAIDPAPFYYKVLCVEKAVSALANPSNVASQSETLGSFSHSETFPRDLDASAFLTEDEERRIRRIATGVVSASARPKSLLHDTIVREPTK